MSDGERTTNPDRTAVTSVGPQKKKQDSGKDACLVVIYGDELGKRIALGEQLTVIGRSTRCAVTLDQESVSRHHCHITFVDGLYEIEDLGSTNGTYVNDVIARRAVLRDGDQIKVGRTILKFILGGNIEGQYHEEIYQLMTLDGLTQVRNKRYFDEMVDREVSRAKRYHRYFSLILFDIDHFKRINDTHGHLAGDAVLRQLGSLMQARVRRDDTLARTGGEEFGILCPEVQAKGAMDLAHKLNRLVDETKFVFEGTRIDVTISLGVAEWSPDFETAEEVLGAADAKLYEAKRLGRNRVCG
jgi:two-component system, cell cycle response regulator